MTDFNEEFALVTQAMAGDQLALAELFENYRQRLSHTVRLRMDPRLHGRLDVSDVLQEAFLDASRRLPEFIAEPDVSLFIWLRSLATQRLIDLHRQHLGAQVRSVARELAVSRHGDLSTSIRSLAGMLADSSKTPASKAVREEMRCQLHQALDAMEPIDREVLAMRHFEMMTNGEVASVLKLSKAAASNRYVRALERLHGILDGNQDFQ